MPDHEQQAEPLSGDAIAALCRPLSAKIMPRSATINGAGIPPSENRAIALQRLNKRAVNNGGRHKATNIGE